MGEQVVAPTAGGFFRKLAAAHMSALAPKRPTVTGAFSLDPEGVDRSFTVAATLHGTTIVTCDLVVCVAFDRGQSSALSVTGALLEVTTTR